MAIVLETGTATGQLDLLQKLNDHVSSDISGWDVISWGSAGAISGFPNDRQLTIHKNAGTDLYVHLISQVDQARPRIYFAGSSGYTGASTPWHSQASGYGPRYGGISVPVSTSGGNPINYFFYSTDDYLIIVLEMDGGWYQHACFSAVESPGGGSVENVAAVITGNILYDWRNEVGADFNNVQLRLNSFLQSTVCIAGTLGVNDSASQSGTAGCAYRRPNGSWNELGSADEYLSVTSAYRSYDRRWDDGFEQYPPSAIIKPDYNIRNNSQNMLAPLETIEITQTGPTSGKYNHVGRIPGIRVVPTNGIAEKAIITIEGIDWRVFPLMKTRRVFHRHQFLGIAVQETE